MKPVLASDSIWLPGKLSGFPWICARARYVMDTIAAKLRDYEARSQSAKSAEMPSSAVSIPTPTALV